jgi:ubiquinone biosynthesis protein COQ9
MTDAPYAAWRDRLLDGALPHAAFEGWNQRTVALAARDAGLSPGEVEQALPRGAPDLIDALADRADQAMLERLSETDLTVLKVREKVALAVRSRLESLAGQQEAVRRAALALALPQNAPDAARIGWRTADRIWRALGDPSTDLNWYTKRGILAGVHAATLAVWLQDDDPAHADTWAFLDRRIAGIMQFEKAKASVRTLASKLPRATDLLARLRYGLTPRPRP